MTIFKLTTKINAPIELCFDACRDIDLHQQSTFGTREKAIAGRTSGLCELDDTITWEATHLGIRQKLTSKITALQFPDNFTDVMIKGAFKSMTHKHQFVRHGNTTIMTDEFTFESPLGILGKLFDKLFLARYMKKFLLKRNQFIKKHVEGKAIKYTEKIR